MASIDSARRQRQYSGAVAEVERRHNTRLWITVAVVAAVVVALLPALVAYRYTAPGQRGEFLSHPWRGWSFLGAALRVPGDSELKTSGEALRKAEWLFKDSVVDPVEVQLLFVKAGEPYAFSQDVAGRQVVAEVTPSYRFIWEVRGTLPGGTGPGASPSTVVVALLDYETGRLLYDARTDLPPDRLDEPASSTPGASASPPAP